MDTYSFGLMKPGVISLDIFESVFGKGFATFIESIKNWPGYESIAKKLVEIQVYVKYTKYTF